MYCLFRELFVSLLLALVVGATGPPSFGPVPAQAQQHIQLTSPQTGQKIDRTYPENADVIFPVTPDSATGWSSQDAVVFNPQDTARVIVEFKRSSVVRRQAELERKGAPKKSFGKRLQSHRAKLEGTLDRFRQDLQEIVQGQDNGGAQRKAAPIGQETFISREYTEVFSGTAVTTREWALESIQALSYVEATHPDRRVEAVVGDARKVVDAEELQAEAGATGEGVEIGILDTGVDYDHPALGGGFGSGNKVVGGRDFVNRDDDPMDDNGHGTHVAGIAAADGEEVTGIAPGAKLRAYKVLGSGGSGRESDIIAGIERAVTDGVDIINLSLGGPGHPNDPKSQAIDNASRAGVLPVVAAGNSGPDYQTVGSPGTARKALTVGASNDTDQIAKFSSRGPTNQVFTVKPDVVAPGVNIRSTVWNGSYGKKSGTSMASPVTAGAAALLLELNPDWSPTFTKGALMNTGIDIGEDIWTQGRGRVDVNDAAEAKVVATPGILSFGLVDNGRSTWTHTDTLKLRNRESAARTYQLSAGSTPAPGVSINVLNSNVTVAGNDSAIVPVKAKVNNDVAPIPEGRPPAFVGKVLATANQDTVEVPYGLVRAPSITLTFDDHVGSSAVFVHRTTSISLKKQYVSTPDKVEVLLPRAGEYDVIAWLKSFRHQAWMYVVREDVSAAETSKLSVGPRQAVHTVTADFKDKNGRPVPNPIPTGPFLLKKKTGAGLFALHTANGQGPGPRARFSSMSDEYTIKGMLNSHQFKNGRLKDYRLPYQFSGISSDKTFTNDPGDLRKTTYRLGKEIVPRALFSPLTHAHFVDHPVVGPVWLSSWRAVASGVWTEAELKTPILADMYVLPSPTQDYRMFPAYRIIDLTSDDIGSRGLFQTGTPRAVGPDTTAFYRFVDFEESVHRAWKDRGPVDIGGSLPRWTADATPGGQLDAGVDAGWFGSPFAGVRLGEVQYEQYDDNALVEKDLLDNAGNVTRNVGERSLEDFGTGDSLVTRFNHPVAGREGQVELRFAPGGGGLQSRFKEFQMLSDEQVSDTLSSSQANEIRAVVDSGAAVKSMTAQISPVDSSGWRQVGNSKSGGTLRVEVPSTLATGHYAVRVVAKGKGGGRVEQVADPAFWFGQQREGPPLPPTSLAVTNPLDSLGLKWSASFETHVTSYRIYRDSVPFDSSAGPSSYEALAVVDVGTFRYIDTDVQPGETYYYRVTAIDEDGQESGFSAPIEAAARRPSLSLSSVETRDYLHGNRDGVVQAGEILYLFLRFVNETDSTLGPETYARIDTTTDRFVHPVEGIGYVGQNNARQPLPPQDTTKFRGGFRFHVAGKAPVGHVMNVPIRMYDNSDRLIGKDTLTLEVEGPDTIPPDVGGFDGFGLDIRPGYAPPGEPIVISSQVTEGSRQVDVNALITRKSDGQQVATVSLEDGPGTPEDHRTGDRTFSGAFTPQQKAEFVVDVTATDASGNTGKFQGASFTSKRFSKDGNVLVVSDNRQPWVDTFEEYYTAPLKSAGYDPDNWSTYIRGEPSSELVNRYDALVWYTGNDSQGIGATARQERAVIASYLEDGGKLLLSGKNTGSNLQRDHAIWLREHLHAEHVQRYVRRFEVEGVEGDPISEGLELALNREAYGTDEINPVKGGVQMLSYNDSVTEPQSTAKTGRNSRLKYQSKAKGGISLRKTYPAPQGKGGGKAGVESSGTAAVRYADGAEQLVYLAFGMEAIAEEEKRNHFMGRVLEWFDNAPIASETEDVDSEGPIDFGESGVTLDFFGMNSTGRATVKEYDEGPSGQVGISGENVSDFRFVIGARDGLEFDSSEVQLAVGNLSGIDDPSNVQIYRREEPGTGTFKSLETKVDLNGTAGNISDDTLSAMTEGFSEFVLASKSEPLPVELATFEGSVDDNRVRLTWQTTSETNNAGFEVQRKSEPGDSWKNVGFVESKAEGGSGAEPLSYEYTDRDLPYAADSLTYRLKQVDTNGSTRHTGKVTIGRGVDKVQLLGTYPNPARSQATVRYALPKRQDVKIRLYDVLGRRVQTLVDGEKEGRQEIRLDAFSLPSGVYFLRLRAGGQTRTQKLTVVR